MNFILSNFLGNSPANSDQIEDKQMIIEKLTAKMVNSAHLEDRKAAAQTIKSLARSHRLEIGTLALQTLVDELRRDFEDEELGKIVLETLDILCSAKEGEEGIEVQFCEILLKNEQNVTLLLDLMGDSDDFYLKFTSIQIFMSLCNSQPFQLQSAVLNSPSGVEKVLNLLKDSREIVRNEGLLFCGALVRGSTDLQKILAFQGAFEQTMKIIIEEENGPWEGPIIIQDAFNLIFELLNLNTANQTYFRDSICFKQLAGILAVPSSGEGADCLWNRTRISNYLAALSLLDGILCKSNVDIEASQYAAMKTHFVSPLILLAFNPKVPQEISTSALNCLSGMIWSNNRVQQEFAKERLSFALGMKRVKPPISPLMAAVCLAVHGNPLGGNVSEEAALNQRLKALELVESFCTGNSDGQLVLLSTLKSTSDSSASPGSVILEALFDLDTSRKRDPWHCWFASGLLSHLINGNEDAKRMLLKHKMIDSDGEEDEDVLTALMLNLIRIARDSRGSTCQKSIIAYLQLIVIWFHESPTLVKHFLQEGSYIQYLIERITHQSYQQDIQIQGISALILGICVLYNDESVPNFGSEALKGVIKNRIGPDLFISKLSRLRTEKNELINAILVKNYDNLVKLVARPTPAGTKASHTATLAQLTKDLVECRALLTDTQTHLTQSETLTETLKIGISERDAYILQLQKIISAKNQKIAQMAHEMSNFEQDLQQQQLQLQHPNEYYERYLSDQSALQSLNETIKSFQETVARQQARIEELEALLNGGKEEGELVKWKEAYHKLYEQVKEQLNFTEESTVAELKVVPVAANVPENASAHIAPFEPDHTVALEALVTDQDVVLSPSMFMSPLTEDSSVSVLSEEPVIIESLHQTVSSQELISLNQIPVAEKLMEYPELNLNVDTSFNAAVIISEEYAFKDPNPATDEKFTQSISAECPPDNFLDSDLGDTEIVSQEEIKNVLGFFDNLPNLSANELDTESIQEGLKALHFESNEEPFVVDSYENQLIDDNQPADTQPFDYFSYNSDNNESCEAADHQSEIIEPVVVEPVEEQNVNIIDSEQVNDNTSFEPTTEYADNFAGSEYNEHENYQDLNGNTIAGQESLSIEQGQEYAETPEYNSTDYAQQVAESEYSQAEPEYPSEYAESYSAENIEASSSEYPVYQDYSNASDYPTENDYTQDYTVSTSECTATQDVSVCAAENNEENSIANQDECSIENFQEQNKSQYNQGYSTDYNQDNSIEYDQGYNTEYVQDYGTGYNQEYNAEYQGEEYITEPQNGQSYDQVHDPHAQSYEDVYTQINQQDDQNYDNEAYDQAQTQAYDQLQTQAYDQTQTQTYDQAQTQTYDQLTQSYDQVQAQSYDQVQAQSYNETQSQSYDQAQAQTCDQTPTESYCTNNTCVIEESQQEQYQTGIEAQQEQAESSDYYYYDEATGFTYGFDQNVNQYYYYDPNTGQYTYYTAETTEGYAHDADYNPNYTSSEAAQSTYSDLSTSSASNPSLFNTSGPPMVPLQQQASALSTNNFVADQIYNL